MNDKREALKQIIKDLHAGAAAKDLRKQFAALIKDTSPEEIADMENALIQDGFPRRRSNGCAKSTLKCSINP
jgi:hypothetical protein